MWNSKFVYFLNYLRILRLCPKTIHRCTHCNKYLQQLQSLYSGKFGETIIVPHLPSFTKKGVCYKIEKVNTTIEFCIFELVLLPNFSLNWQVWFFGPNLPKKGVFSLKQKKLTVPLNSAYLNKCRSQISA